MKIDEVIELQNKQLDKHRNEQEYDTFMRDRYEYMVQSLEVIKEYFVKHKNKTKIKVADIGTGYGALAIWLKQNGYEVDAFDIMPELHSKTLFKTLSIPFTKLNIETDKISGQYDIVLFLETIEHLCFSPLVVVEKLKDLISKDGMIIITTPSRELDPKGADGNWAYEVNWKQIETPKEYKWVDGNHHYYYLWELFDLVKEAGLNVQTIKLESFGWLLILRK
jgi:2-polyprenyl-3-methyl-5-hydroxy-6-metoxy-1,4-benzoquinol methylase